MRVGEDRYRWELGLPTDEQPEELTDRRRLLALIAPWTPGIPDDELHVRPAHRLLHPPCPGRRPLAHPHLPARGNARCPAAAVTPLGKVLGTESFPATAAGYRRLLV